MNSIVEIFSHHANRQPESLMAADDLGNELTYGEAWKHLPASVSYILSGLKVAGARAWRGLISAEMIFGLASVPGIGLYINQMRTNLKNAEMYATLIVIIIIGVIVQYGILGPIERNTVKKWGMSR